MRKRISRYCISHELEEKLAMAASKDLKIVKFAEKMRHLEETVEELQRTRESATRSI